MGYLMKRKKKEKEQRANKVTTSRYAEMGGPEKNQISHRGKALVKLQDWFKKELTS